MFAADAEFFNIVKNERGGLWKDFINFNSIQLANTYNEVRSAQINLLLPSYPALENGEIYYFSF